MRDPEHAYARQKPRIWALNLTTFTRFCYVSIWGFRQLKVCENITKLPVCTCFTHQKLAFSSFSIFMSAECFTNNSQHRTEVKNWKTQNNTDPDQSGLPTLTHSRWSSWVRIKSEVKDIWKCKVYILFSEKFTKTNIEREWWGNMATAGKL